MYDFGLIIIYISIKSIILNIFREDLSKQTELTEKYHGRVKELKVLLESSRSRVDV